MEFTSSREVFRDLVAKHPSWHASDFARVLGISRERVRQLTVDMGIILPRKTSGPPRREPRVRTGPEVAVVAPAGGVSCTVRGTIGELIVAADLLARRFQVYAPITRHTARCDLIALAADGSRTLRIEVRTGSRRSGAIQYNRHGSDKNWDHMAVVLAGEPILYVPPLLP